MCTYLLVEVFSSLDTDNGCNGLCFCSSDGIVQELSFHCGIIFDVRWLVHASIECFGTGSKRSFAIGLTIHVLRFDSSDVSTITCRTPIVSSVAINMTYLEFAFLDPSFVEHWHHDPPLMVCDRCNLGLRS